ncbi:MAG TPA: hypothetical protein PKA77_03905 [Chitinophagaceae bacterium]|jgi:hypothetical protein|nr:hypothetical protein [Chitinophagaceae bacterium]HMU58620.1 hypothetical protein [Chitinophagaceae bacterium]
MMTHKKTPRKGQEQDLTKVVSGKKNGRLTGLFTCINGSSFNTAHRVSFIRFCSLFSTLLNAGGTLLSKLSGTMLMAYSLGTDLFTLKSDNV